MGQGNDKLLINELALKEPSEERPNRVSSVAEENENIHSKPDFPNPIPGSPSTPGDVSKLKPRNDPVVWLVDESTRDYFTRTGFSQSKDDNFAKSKIVQYILIKIDF